MTEPRVIELELDYEDWTVDELHAFRDAVGVNAPYAAAKIGEAKGADFKDLFARLIEAGAEPGGEIVPPADWQPLNILTIDPEWMLGFAFIPARRSDPDLEWKALTAEVRAGQLLQAYADSVFAIVPDEEPDDSAPLVEDSEPTTTTPPSKTKRSSPTPTSGASAKSARSATVSSPKL